MSTRDERGTGVFGTVFGVGIVLVFLLIAAHVLLHLYATSVVEAVSYDAVQAVSGAGGTTVPTAESNARQLLGGLSDTTTFVWDVSADEVVLTVTAERSSLVPQAFAGPLGLTTIEREFRMRVEDFR